MSGFYQSEQEERKKLLNAYEIENSRIYAMLDKVTVPHESEAVKPSKDNLMPEVEKAAKQKIKEVNERRNEKWRADKNNVKWYDPRTWSAPRMSASEKLEIRAMCYIDKALAESGNEYEKYRAPYGYNLERNELIKAFATVIGDVTDVCVPRINDHVEETIRAGETTVNFNLINSAIDIADGLQAEASKIEGNRTGKNVTSSKFYGGLKDFNDSRREKLRNLKNTAKGIVDRENEIRKQFGDFRQKYTLIDPAEPERKHTLAEEVFQIETFAQREIKAEEARINTNWKQEFKWYKPSTWAKKKLSKEEKLNIRAREYDIRHDLGGGDEYVILNGRLIDKTFGSTRPRDRALMQTPLFKGKKHNFYIEEAIGNVCENLRRQQTLEAIRGGEKYNSENLFKSQAFGYYSPSVSEESKNTITHLDQYAFQMKKLEEIAKKGKDSEIKVYQHLVKTLENLENGNAAQDVAKQEFIRSKLNDMGDRFIGKEVDERTLNKQEKKAMKEKVKKDKKNLKQKTKLTMRQKKEIDEFIQQQAQELRDNYKEHINAMEADESFKYTSKEGFKAVNNYMEKEYVFEIVMVGEECGNLVDKETGKVHEGALLTDVNEVNVAIAEAFAGKPLWQIGDNMPYELSVINPDKKIKSPEQITKAVEAKKKADRARVMPSKSQLKRRARKARKELVWTLANKNKDKDNFNAYEEIKSLCNKINLHGDGLRVQAENQKEAEKSAEPARVNEVEKQRIDTAELSASNKAAEQNLKADAYQIQQQTAEKKQSELSEKRERATMEDLGKTAEQPNLTKKADAKQRNARQNVAAAGK